VLLDVGAPLVVRPKSDPLAQFRKKPVGAEAMTPIRESDEYVPFEAKDRVERLKIRCKMAPTRAPGYAWLLDIAYDGSFGTNFVLGFTFMMVLVRGKNLQSVIAALEMGTADFIQEFDADRWQKPKDLKAPFIESIEYVMPEDGPITGDAATTRTPGPSGKPH